MPRYIDVDFIAQFPHWQNIVKELECAPTADVQEVKHGKWVYRDDGRYHRTRAYCTNCELPSGIGGIRENQAKPYCPNCGARMDGDEE